MQKKRYPFEFSTEASINLSDDAELLAELRAANFFLIFVGIESPDTETLILARKTKHTAQPAGEHPQDLSRRHVCRGGVHRWFRQRARQRRRGHDRVHRGYRH